MQKLGKLAETSVDALQMRIEREKAALGLGDIRDTAEMALHGLGYGKPVGQSKPAEVNLQVVMVSKDELAAARRIMRRGPVQEDQDDAQSFRALPATA